MSDPETTPEPADVALAAAEAAVTGEMDATSERAVSDREIAVAAIAAFLDALPAHTLAGGPALFHAAGLSRAVKEAANER